MVLKIITAHDAKPGSIILIDGEAFNVRNNDVSKTGKHGASKCRIEAKSVLGDKKKIVAVPGDTKFDVPMIEKRKAQILSLEGEKASVMDLENFETLEIVYSEELKAQIIPEKQVEYWDIEGKKCIMRVF